MDPRQIVDSSIGERSMVDSFRSSRLSKRFVRHRRPSFTDPDQLLFSIGSREPAGFSTAAPPRIPEKGFGSGGWTPVQEETLRNDQVNMRVMAVRPPSVDGPRIGHPALLALPAARHFQYEFPGQGDPFLLVQLDGQRELILTKKRGVFPLVEVGCLPIKTGLPGGPLRHVSTFGKKDLPGTGRVFPRPNNVVVFRPRRLSGLSTSDRCVQVVDSHAFSPSSPCGGRGAGVGGVPLTALACLDPKGRDLPKCALALKPGKGLRQKSREKHLERQVLSSLATGLDHDMINAINCQKL